MADSDDLDLAELAKAASVTPRTVRYYVQQGLLPAPRTRGPGTKYDRALVDRLYLIRRLQRDHWPLSKIREHLESLDEEGVRLALGEPPELPFATHAMSDSDVDLGEARGFEDAEPGALERFMRLGRSRSGKVQEPSLFSPEPPSPARGKWQMTKSTWERIRLARDVELSVRRPLTREDNKRVDRLLEAAKEIFSDE